MQEDETGSAGSSVEVLYYASQGIDRNCRSFVGEDGLRRRLFKDKDDATFFRGLMLHRSLRKNALFTELSVREVI